MGAPEWLGWLVLVVLFGGFGALTWWLLFSPIAAPVLVHGGRSIATTRIVSWLVFASGVAFVVGTAWDELWHRMYGGFGDDFLWPPHLLMYLSLGLNLVFAVGGVGLALRSRGGLRQRFRAEPLLSLLGLIAAYQMASIPSDLLWHEIIGPDLTAWSLPHVLLVVTTAGTWLVGLALARSTRASPRWRSLTDELSGTDILSLGFVTLTTGMFLQLGVTEWDWVGGGLGALLARPSWSYPVVVLAIGVATAHLALHATRRIGAATAVALATVAIRLVTVGVDRAFVADGPTLGAHLMLILPAIALDLWYASRRVPGGAGRDWLFGSVLYGVVFLIVGLPYAQVVIGVPGLDAMAIVQSLAIGLLASAITGIASRDIGNWAAELSKP